MSGEVPVTNWTRAPRRRAALNLALAWTPAILVAGAAAWRLAGAGWATGIALTGLLVLAGAAARIVARFDRTWLVRRLDAREDGLEDSADLLFGGRATLGPIQQLQRARIERRVAAIDPDTLVDAWAHRWIAPAWIAGAVASAAILLWPAAHPAPPPLSPAAEGTAAAPGEPRLTGQRVRIVPPAYTGLPARYATGLDVRAPTGSRIEWTLAFTPQPTAAAIQLLGGQHLPLRATREGWAGALRLDRPLLYRVTAGGMRATPPLHRLEPIADTPPQLRVVAPAQTLVLAKPGQRSWRVVFEASDDYAVAATAKLTVTVAKGDGENVSFTERSRIVRGSGAVRKRRFAIDLDLASYGLEPGSDLVAQLTVADTRMPDPHVVRGPGVILRWPPKPTEESGGLEMMAKRVMPAYFRSQRQIIIDTEALIRERKRLSADAFLAKSDAIGADQRLLRLRYGQFVGMEDEGQPKAPPLPIADDAPPPAEPEHREGDGHDHGDGSASAPKVFGQAGDVTAEFGHTHDESEAATLLDPDTRTMLKQALEEMWQAELNLRSGKPEAALPYENRALAWIKKIQQATRIYLPRVGTQLPPVDMARRMTGKREGIASRAAQLTPFAIDDAAPADTWRALARPGPVDLDALDRWIRTNTTRIRDPLAVLKASAELRADPGSGAARERLRAQLWAVLTRPPAEVRRRGDGGAIGRRYIGGLR
ncbi:DUF4175 domain-containing protein [Sphingomonas sp.]|uniref:DUF4175 domain-containing protein n=1 Tax=Sphingomonas sp. TaxID=28214 RepID=UPI001EB14BEF|nr:DUF4175 domain-containing protein [Sphingomonas sp.]MBX3593264.1 DUF4175 domain-containing protein [Sphingomonas sp.]